MGYRRSVRLQLLVIGALTTLPLSALAEAVPQAAQPSTAADLASDALTILAWPAELDATEGLLLGGAAAGTAALLGADTRLYGHLGSVRWTMRGHSLFNYTLHGGNGLFDLAVLGAFALGGERGRRTSVTGIEALISVAATSVLLKHLFRVQRPEVDSDSKGYFRSFRDDAFPSGHTMAAFATASVISAEYPMAAPFAYGAASLVGLSVMKKGWHWPSDVLAGGALGALIGRVSVRVNQRRIAMTAKPGGLGIQAEL